MPHVVTKNGSIPDYSQFHTSEETSCTSLFAIPKGMSPVEISDDKCLNGPGEKILMVFRKTLAYTFKPFCEGYFKGVTEENRQEIKDRQPKKYTNKTRTVLTEKQSVEFQAINQQIESLARQIEMKEDVIEKGREPLLKRIAELEQEKNSIALKSIDGRYHLEDNVKMGHAYSGNLVGSFHSHIGEDVVVNENLASIDKAIGTITNELVQFERDHYPALEKLKERNLNLRAQRGRILSQGETQDVRVSIYSDGGVY